MDARDPPGTYSRKRYLGALSSTRVEKEVSCEIRRGLGT